MLTDADKRMLVIGLRENGGFHLATQWYLRGLEPLPFQYAWHHWNVMNTSLVAGIATGKTTIVAASNVIDCITLPYFRALNTSVTARQAELAFDMVMGWIEGNDRLEHLVEKVSLRPYPSIKWKNFSEYEFRTAGTDARFIRGSEYDRINYDEAGLDYNGISVKVLRGRLRGKRATGEARMARMDITTSPTDAPWLLERWNRGLKGHQDADLERYRSLRVATWDNTKLTPEQIEAMKAEYPPDMIDVEMGGMFPDYGLSMFPNSHIQACTNPSLNDAAYLALHPEDGGKVLKGYTLEEDPRHGVFKIELPPVPGHIYIIAGDPGTDNYPKRNSACVMAADVTTVPYRLVYFAWISGKGSYNPFLREYKYAIDRYSPIFKGIDATGTQKGLDEIAFENAGIITDKLAFNTDKNAMLNNLSMDITNHHWEWPRIKGLNHQLGTYTLDADKKGHPQDLVMTMCQISFLARYVPPDPAVNATVAKANFRNRRHRTTAYRRR